MLQSSSVVAFIKRLSFVLVYMAMMVVAVVLVNYLGVDVLERSVFNQAWTNL